MIFRIVFWDVLPCKISGHAVKITDTALSGRIFFRIIHHGIQPRAPTPSTAWGGSDIEGASYLNFCTLSGALTNIFLAFDISFLTSG
jgi:hypothetical protein